MSKLLVHTQSEQHVLFSNLEELHTAIQDNQEQRLQLLAYCKLVSRMAIWLRTTFSLT